MLVNSQTEDNIPLQSPFFYYVLLCFSIVYFGTKFQLLGLAFPPITVKDHYGLCIRTRYLVCVSCKPTKV